MADLDIVINGKPYTIRCNDGEEAHVTALASELEARVKHLVQSLGQVGDARLLLMAALIIADEVQELRCRSAPASVSPPVAHESDVAQVIEGLALRIKAVAERFRAT